MADPDENKTSPNSEPERGLLARVARWDSAIWVAFAASLVLGMLAFWGRLEAGEFIVGAFFLVTLAVFLPRREVPATPAASFVKHQSAEADPIVEAVADAFQSPTLLLDRKSMVVHRNPAAAQSFPQANVGAPLTYALRQPALLEALARAIRDDQPQVIELHQASPNQVWYAVTITPFALPGVEGSDAQRLLVTFTNLTEQRRTETMRVDFVANASHELRTPLTSVIGFIDTLLGPAAEDPEARKKFLTIMRTQAERMSNLIEDLMSLSRIEMRQHVRPTGSADLAPLLRTVVEGLQTQIAEAGVTLDLDLADGDTRVTGDQNELYEVFENLMDNAIKYGASGENILLRLEQIEDRPGQAFRVTVQDFGAGIDADLVPRLTERFYRVDAESSRKKKGTGLGLAIVKHIVNRHRGQLIIRSAVGEGMKVEVLLPR